MKINSKGGASVPASQKPATRETAREDARPTKLLLSFFVAAILFFTFGAAAETTNDLSKAEMQGRQLAKEILEEIPATNFTQKGVLRIQNSKGATTNIPVTFETVLNGATWVEFCWAFQTNGYQMGNLTIIHLPSHPNQYSFFKRSNIPTEKLKNEGVIWSSGGIGLNKDQIMAPFANSDFWICDLGLEFFHWPDQKILKEYDMRRGRACKVLESVNLNPTANGYSRVVSWIDNETLGIVHAEAYDAKGKLLKIFEPKSFKKVNGQWELQDMQIQNVQTGSRTRIEFNLK